MRPSFVRSFAAGALALLLAACEPEQPASEPVPSGTPTEQPAPSQPRAEQPTRDSTSFEGTMREVSAEPSGMTAVATLQDIRAAAHDGYDRIVFAFDGSGQPGYAVGYTEAVQECGSGRPVEVEGDALLHIRVHPARAHTDAGQLSIASTSLAPDLPVLRVAERTCDFEGEIGWVLGLAEQQPFRVQQLVDPLRLVVDVAHAE